MKNRYIARSESISDHRHLYLSMAVVFPAECLEDPQQNAIQESGLFAIKLYQLVICFPTGHSTTTAGGPRKA